VYQWCQVQPVAVRWVYNIHHYRRITAVQFETKQPQLTHTNESIEAPGMFAKL